ncbi:MAG: hypothetical protein AAFV29_13840 [Myxococcota bacterium]
MSNASPPRRSPLVRLLEDYVLDAIGELPDDEAAQVAVLVRAVFKTSAPWRVVVEEQFGLADELRGQLSTLWAQNRGVVESQGAKLTARDFAILVVDENFSDTLEMLATEIGHSSDPDD